jgi:hypothetical protein
MFTVCYIGKYFAFIIGSSGLHGAVYSTCMRYGFKLGNAAKYFLCLLLEYYNRKEVDEKMIE